MFVRTINGVSLACVGIGLVPQLGYQIGRRERFNWCSDLTIDPNNCLTLPSIHASLHPGASFDVLEQSDWAALLLIF